VWLVLRELRGQPGLEAIALARGVAVRRVAAEQRQVPHRRLVGGEARVGQQAVDQLAALAGVGFEELARLLVGGERAGEVEEGAAEEGGVGGGAGGGELLALPDGLDLGIDEIAERLLGAGGAGEQGQEDQAAGASERGHWGPPAGGSGRCGGTSYRPPG